MTRTRTLRSSRLLGIPDSPFCGRLRVTADRQDLAHRVWAAYLERLLL